ncbi:MULTISPECIES: LexA family protein [unclassified Paraeggerthella]|uniref:LexA family protein n=1 Tax=unclassified Paraeggerthella TaxID=2641972 RepID=UPI001CE41B9F|nr:XRE family transcriptional regulator [Paraeggerthella sp. Marseille-Q4926]
MEYPNRIRELRKAAKMSQRKLAEIVEVSDTSLQYYEYGDRDLPGDVIIKLCKVFDCTADYLLCVEDDDGVTGSRSAIKPSYSHHVVPMLGNVAAGEWREVYVQDGETVSIPDEFRDSHPRAFGVKPTGHSMDLLFRDDEIALCDPDMDVRDGSVALVGVNGDEATIKRVFFAGNTIVLHAESTMVEDYPDIAINTKDPASPPVHLIGEVFWKTLPAKPIKF